MTSKKDLVLLSSKIWEIIMKDMYQMIKQMELENTLIDKIILLLKLNGKMDL